MDKRTVFISISFFLISALTIFFITGKLSTTDAKVKIKKENDNYNHKEIANKNNYQPNEVLVKFKDKVKKSQIKQKGEKVGVATNNQKVEKEEGVVRLKVKDPIKASKRLNKDPDIIFAEPNYKLKAFTTPNDTDYSQQWGLKQAFFPSAWSVTTGSTNTKIAVIDTGVDWDHPDLAANIYSNDGETVNDSDSDSNGYVDDIRGWDFVTQTDCYPGEDCDGVRDNNPMDFQGHGTAVSGVASATTNNERGVAGAGWKTKIVPIRAGYARAGDGKGELLISDLSAAIRYAADNNFQIINISSGGTNESSTLKSAIDYAAGKNCLIIAAAGNNNTNTKFYPAAYKKVVAVGGTNSYDNRWSSSNYGNWVNISAPASSIYTTNFDDSYTTGSGTSLAAPLVSGAAALIKSKDTSLNRRELAEKLIAGSSTPTNILLGKKLNAARTLKPTVKYPDGTLIQPTGSGTIYLVEDGLKKPVSSAKVFANRYGWKDVITTSKSLADSIPTGNYIGFREGTLLKVKGKGTIYLVENNKLRPFPNPSTFEYFGYKWKNIITERASKIWRCHNKGKKVTKTENYPDGTLLKVRDKATIYVVDDNKARPISSITVFNSWRFRWRNLVIVSKNAINAVGKGPNLLHRNGTLVRKSSTIYYIQNNTLRAFPSANRFRNYYGYRWDRVFDIKSRTFSAYKKVLLPIM